MPITVALVEDDPNLRQGLGRLIEQTGDIRCVGSYATGEEALQGIPQATPEVALMDINLPGMDGIECVRQLKEIRPRFTS